MNTDEIQQRGIERLPVNLYEALMELSKDEVIKSALGEYAYKRFSEAAAYEWNDYSKYISQWEIDRYLRKF